MSYTLYTLAIAFLLLISACSDKELGCPTSDTIIIPEASVLLNSVDTDSTTQVPAAECAENTQLLGP